MGGHGKRKLSGQDAKVAHPLGAQVYPDGPVARTDADSSLTLFSYTLTVCYAGLEVDSLLSGGRTEGRVRGFPVLLLPLVPLLVRAANLPVRSAVPYQ